MDKGKIAKLAFSVLFMLLIASPLSFYASAQSNTNKLYGGTLRVARGNDPISFNGALNFYNPDIAGDMFNRLITYDANYNLKGDLAQSWESSADGKTWTFHLYKNVKWHDGVPFTSADVKWYYTMLTNQTSIMRAFLNAAKLLSIDTPDDYTVIFHFQNLANPTNIFAESQGDSFILPKHIFEGPGPYGYDPTAFRNNPANLKPIGTGPFKFVDYVRDDHVTMEANPEYFMGRPYLDRLVWRIIPQQQTAELAFQNGQIDNINEALGLPFADISTWQKKNDTTVDAFQIHTTWRITFNFRPNALAKFPYIGDVRVRQAMWYAIDRQSIINTVLYGITSTTDTAISNVIQPFYNPNTVKYPYNPDKANQLLDDAGYMKGADGWRFHVPMVCYQTGSSFAEVIKQYLSKVGIDIQLTLVENTTFFSLYEINPQGFGDNVAMGIQTEGTGPDPVTIFDWITSRQTGFGGQNSGFYSNPTVDKLLLEAQNSMNYTLRKSNYFQVQDILAKEVPMIFLFNVWRVEVWKNAFNGFKDTERPISRYGNHRGVWWTQGKPLTTTTTVPMNATTAAQPPTGGFDATTIGAIVLLIVVVAGTALYMSKRKKTASK